MHNTTQKKSLARVIIPILAALAVALAALNIFLALDNSSGRLPSIQNPFAPAAAPPYIVQGSNIQALTLAPAAGDMSSEALSAHYAAAVAFAQQNNINTLIYEGKSGLSVYWRDKNFPLADAIASQDTLTHKLDPLALLIDAAKDSGVQVWLQIDPYNAAGYHAEMRSAAAELAAAQIGGRFAAGDAAYTELLLASLTALPRNYSLAGLVFCGLDAADNPGADAAAWGEGFSSMVQALRSGWDAKGYTTQIALRLDGEGGSLLSAEAAASLGAAGSADYLIPTFAAQRGLVDTIAKWAQAGPLIIQQPAADTSGSVLFTAANAAPGFAGVLYGSYTSSSAAPAGLMFLQSATQQLDSPLPTGFDIPQTLAISYPEKDSLTWENVYITGTSNPAHPLTLNGTEVPNRAYNGAFGVYVPLALGQNTFSFVNGDASITKTITRTEPSQGGNAGGTGGGTGETAPQLQPGDAILISTAFASALIDPADYTSVNETFLFGGVLVVRESVRYGQNGATAYKLASGDYVLPTNCTPIYGGQSSFSGLAALPDENGEYLCFEGSGTPAPYLAFDDDTGILRVTMYDTSFALADGFSSQFVSRAWLEDIEDGVVLALQTNGIWGYQIEYVDEGTRLFLRRPPAISANPAAPLEGVTVMLDPGHGESTPGTNYGAVGISGSDGYPHEQHINLALAQITAYRLRQLGATVILTREDSTNPTIYQRYNMQNRMKPHFFISIHHDGLDGYMDLSERDNLLSYYYHPYDTPPSRGFAQKLMDNISAATGRTATEARWGGVNYGVLRTTVCPSVLFEYGLLVHPAHYDGATSTDGLYAAAAATAEAILACVPGAADTPADNAATSDTDNPPPAGGSISGGVVDPVS